jgi:hypothetical protein
VSADEGIASDDERVVVGGTRSCVTPPAVVDSVFQCFSVLRNLELVRLIFVVYLSVSLLWTDRGIGLVVIVECHILSASPLDRLALWNIRFRLKLVAEL